MITYQMVLDYLINQKKYKYHSKKNYLIILFTGSKYHLTIFRDQWDEYYSKTNNPYHLFHISSNDDTDRCSSYFWVNFKNKIQNIPKKYFQYNQPSYSFNSSTRSSCNFKEIKPILISFKKLINDIPQING